MGATLTVLKVGSLSNVLAKSKASSLLKWLAHFWSSSAVLTSVEALAGLLLSDTSFAGLSVDDLAFEVVAFSFSNFCFFFQPNH